MKLLVLTSQRYKSINFGNNENIPTACRPQSLSDEAADCFVSSNQDSNNDEVNSIGKKLKKIFLIDKLSNFIKAHIPYFSEVPQDNHFGIEYSEKSVRDVKKFVYAKMQSMGNFEPIDIKATLGFINYRNKDAMYKIFSDEKICKNKELMSEVKMIAGLTKIHGSEILSKVLSDEKLYSNKNIISSLVTLLIFGSEENKPIIYKILSDENLKNNKNLDSFIRASLSNMNEKNKPFIEKILSNPKLYSQYHDEDNINSLDFLLPEINNKNEKIVDLILSDEKLYTDKYFMEHLHDIAISVNSTNKELLNNILTRKDLHSVPNIKKIFFMAMETKNSTRVNFFEKILSNQYAYYNNTFVNRMKVYLNRTYSSSKIKSHLRLMDKIYNNPILVSNSNIAVNSIGKIFDETSCTEAQSKLIDKILSDEKLRSNTELLDNIPKIMANINTNNEGLAFKIIDNYKKYGIKSEEIPSIIDNFKKMSKDFIQNQDLKTLNENFKNQLKKALKTPELYVNGEYNTKEDVQKAVKYFFNNNRGKIMLLSSVYDKDVVTAFLKMRFGNVQEYFEQLKNFNSADLELLSKLSKSLNISGKPFLPTQQIEFIDLISAYKEGKLSYSEINQMIKENRVDPSKLNMNLLIKILQKVGFSSNAISKMPKEKILAWDKKYIHLLAREMHKVQESALYELISIANSQKDFMKQIHSIFTPYGNANNKTKDIFEANNLDYEKWIKPPKKHEIRFIAEDENYRNLSSIAVQINENMNKLRETKAKPFIDKQLARFIKDDKFILPKEYYLSRTKLEELLNILSDTSNQGQLAQIWKRAKVSVQSDNAQKVSIANNILTILDQFKNNLQNLKNVKCEQISKNLDLTVKMWDRNPTKDIFQGNYSTCCIGMGDMNGSTMPYYILNTAFNMIEIVDNKTGKTIGNALCYFVVDQYNKKSFIIDNIEISNKVNATDEMCKQIRDKVTQYSASFLKDVTDEQSTPIYMSREFNDVPTEDLKSREGICLFLGELSTEGRVYMDLFGGWSNGFDLYKDVTLLELAK